MNEAITWVQDGEISYDAGDFGGDIQVGPAISVRFRSDERPDARFEVVMYATAKEWLTSESKAPECLHSPVLLESDGGVGQYAPMPAEHIACTHVASTVDVQAQYTYRRNGRIEDGLYESDDSDHITYDWVGSDYGYNTDKGMVEEIRLATEDAKIKIRRWVENVNQWLVWDGVSTPKD